MNWIQRLARALFAAGCLLYLLLASAALAFLAGKVYTWLTAS